MGYAVDSLDYNDIAEKIIKISDGYETKSKNCIELFHKFDWSIIAAEYANIYTGIIKKTETGLHDK